MKPTAFQRLNTWINDRWPLARFMAWGLHEEIPGGTRFSYTLGSASMFLFMVQVVTGIWQMFYYVPTVDHAYESLNYLRFEVAFGWLMHGLHYWGATAFTVVVGLHVIRVFIWGAYKKPRELVWLAGVVLLVMTAMFMFTGPVLPWDKKGYWAGEVGLNMAGSVPFVGSWMQNLLQGSTKMGQIALTRLYVIHVAIIPFFTILFVIIHLIAFRTYGSIGPWKESERKKKPGEFWPEQLFKDAIVALSIFLLLVWLSAFMPAPVAGLADPMDTLYTPKPEWNFLFLYECLRYFSGALEPLGTVGLPLIIILLLLSLPFLDKSPERDPLKRGFVMSCGGLFVAFVLWMTYHGYYGTPPQDLMAKTRLIEMKQIARTVKDSKGKVDVSGVRQPGMMKSRFPDDNVSGKQLFGMMGCAQCHSVNGKPNGKEGPDLSLVLIKDIPREWLWVQLVAPEKHNPRTIMPPYSHLSDRQINTLIDYLQSLVSDRGEQTPQQAAEAGRKLFHSLGCVQCHTAQGTPSGKLGPDLVMAFRAKKVDRAYLRGQITNPKSHNLASIMPSYARLEDHQIDALIAFFLSLADKPNVPLEVTQSNVSNLPGHLGEAGGPVPSDEEPLPEADAVGAAIHIVGNREHGQVLFQQYCMRCHGPEGTVNPSDAALLPGVPSIVPINHDRFSADPLEFILKIDPLLQHGSVNKFGGPNMPPFGDTHSLTQAQIADLEAYVLELNGVDREMVLVPGVEPKNFFYILFAISVGMSVFLWILWLRATRSTD